jgi:hypothetical protein
LIHAPTDARTEGGRSPWERAIRAVSGASRAINIPAAELAAVQGWVADLEADLTEPPSAADKSILASLARLALLELRLSRSVFVKGAVRKTGEVRPAIVELRQVVRLKADLLARLSFRAGPKPVQDLRTLWSGAGEPEDGERSGPDPGASPDGDRPRAPAPGGKKVRRRPRASAVRSPGRRGADG